MATIITSTIGTGGTYTTVAAWWASLPASLVTADEVHIGQLLNQEHDCTPTITFSGKAVDATRYAELTAAPGASWTDMPLSPMRYGFGARIVTNYDFGIGFFIDAGQVVRLSKFQVINLGTGYTLDSGSSGGGPANMDRVLMEGKAASNAFAGVAQLGGGSASNVRQCVVIRTQNFNDAPVAVMRARSYGCTFANLGTTIPAVVLGDSDTNQVMVNAAVFGGTNALGGSSTWAASGCVTDDTTPPAGFTTAALSTSTGAKFGNITTGTHDLRTTSGSALIGAGVQDLTNSAADAYGTTRKNPPDAGAFETPAAAPVITGPSGAAGAATSTANIAENATTGPTFSTDIALGVGYPTLTGAQAANWSITALTATSWRVDPVTPFDFEAGGLANPQTIVFSADAATSQTCTVTITNASEPPLAPTIGTATAGNASASVAFTPPSNTGRPAITGYTATSSPGGLTGTGATSPITVSGLTNGTAYTFTVTATNADGTGSASAASSSVTPNFTGPVLSSPAKDTPTATTATMGFSTTGTDGTARAVWVPGATVPATPSATQVKAGQNAAGGTSGVVAPAALSITSSGTKNFAAVTVTTGLTYYGFVVHTNATETDSAVLALGPVYPGTGRAVSDLSVTGWTGSGGGLLADLLNEDAADDASFITSPALSSTPAGATFTLNKAYGAGTYAGMKARLWTSVGTALARIKFLDNSGAVVGVTADQTVTTTPTTFTMSVTLTGTATRWMLETNV